MNKKIYKELKKFDGIPIEKYVSETIKKYAQFRGKHLRKIFLQEFGIPLGCHVGYGVLSRVSMPSCGDCYAIFDYYFNGKRFAREFQRSSGLWTSDLYIVKTYPEEFIPTKGGYDWWVKEPDITVEDILNGKYRFVDGHPVRR